MHLLQFPNDMLGAECLLWHLFRLLLSSSLYPTVQKMPDKVTIWSRNPERLPWLDSGHPAEEWMQQITRNLTAQEIGAVRPHFYVRFAPAKVCNVQPA